MWVTINADPVSWYPLQLKFSGNKDLIFTEAYLNLFRAKQKFGNYSGNDIELVEFTSGYSLFVVDIDPALTLIWVENCLRQDKRGMVRLEAKFDNALPETIKSDCLSGIANYRWNRQSQISDPWQYILKDEHPKVTKATFQWPIHQKRFTGSIWGRYGSF